MARQRMIHPNFFIDDDVAMLSPWARLLFLSLLTQADREGRLEDKPGRIRAQAFPFDQVDINGNLEELVEQCFILRYQAGGRKLIQVRSFLKYQKPHHKEEASKLQACPVLDPCLPQEKRSNPTETETETVPKTESETEQSVAVDPTPAVVPALPVSLDADGEPMPELSAYGAAVVEEWHRLRGSDFPQPSNRDFVQLSDWHGSGVPLRVVLRGITDCVETMLKRRDSPKGKPLAYYHSAVKQAYGQYRSRIA
jgi:hypothetical protein